MADPTRTLREWPPPGEPVPVGVAALGVLVAKIDDPAWVEHPPGSNQGRVVCWACERWLSPQRFGELYAARALAWCAGAVCSSLVEAGSTEIKSVASLSCESLWWAMLGRGWGVPAGEERAGDLYFLGQRRKHHVGFVERPGIVLQTVSGNSNAPGAKTPDRVARHSMLRVVASGFARVPG